MKFSIHSKSFVLLLVLFLCNMLCIGTLKANDLASLPEEQQQPLTEILKEISEKYEVIFSFQSKLLSDINVHFEFKEGESAESTVKRLLSKTNLEYRPFGNKYYIIHPKTKKGIRNAKKLGRKIQQIQKLENQGTFNLRPQESSSAEKLNNIVNSVVELKKMVAITGTVIDESGEPLIGVNILVKGSSKGAVTDLNGQFNIDVEDTEATLIISYVGYETIEVPLNGQTDLQITMQADAEALDEVVVVGYGAVKKSDLTGSVSSISSDDLKAVPITSLDQGLQGRAAGVQVTQNSGQPGGATSIRVRGGNSINAGNEPLYVIDGFPVYNDNRGSQAGAIFAPSQNVLATLNPNDIESIEVLKDASSTAIYGSRGANGVVIITTKRGKEGKGNIDFESFYGIQEVARLVPVLNARQYAEFRNDAFVNGGGQPTFSSEEVAALGEGTNWQEELFRTAPMQNYQLTFSGGTPRSKYALSFNYFDQEGIILNSGFERFSTRLNIDSEVNDRIKVGGSLTYNTTFSDVARTGAGINGTQSLQSPNGSVVASAIFYNPIIPVRDENGNFTLNNAVDTRGSGGGNQANVPFGNPIALATLAVNENITNRFLGNIFAEIKLFEGLTFKTTLGADVINNKQNSFTPSSIQLGIRDNGFAQVASASSFSWLSENIFTYTKEFNSADRLDIVAGFTAQKFEQETHSSRASDFTNNLLSFNSLQAGAIQGPNFSTFSDWALLSYLGRVNYTLKNKFLFTVTGRVDGSSRFGDDNKYAFFPSGAFAWKLGQEDFIQDLGIFSDLKLRASVGVTGNQEIAVYQSLARLGINRYIFNGSEQIGISPTNLPNPGLKWETTTQYDLGLDMSFWDGRLTLTTDFYYKRTNDLLLGVQLPRSSGFSAALQNLGEVENKGFELAIGTVNTTGAFKWTTDFNFSLNRNKVLDLGEDFEILDDGGFSANNGFNLFKGRIISVIREGEPVGNFFGFENAGVFRDQADVDNSPTQNIAAPGIRKYVDQNGDGVINDADRVIIGNALPDFIGGINNTFSYKNFDLNVFFQFSVGNDVYNLIQLEAEFLNGRQNNSTTVLDRWTPENPDTDVQRAHNPNNGTFRDSQSRFVEDASFLRMRNISLGYNLPVGDIAWLRNARFYVSAQNLWTLTNYSGFDPEVNITQESNTRLGFDYGAYPLPRTFTFGINLGF